MLIYIFFLDTLDIFQMENMFILAVEKSANMLTLSGQEYYINISLALHNLQKKYIKSGSYKMSEAETKQRIGIMLAQLEACVHSDDLLMLDSNFELDISFTKIHRSFNNNSVYNNLHIVEIKSPHLKRTLWFLERKIFNNRNLYVNSQNKIIFSKLLSHGILDISLLNKCQTQCLLISVLFSKILIDSHHDSRIALHFLEKYQYDLNYLINWMIPSRVKNLQMVCTLDVGIFEIIAKEFLNCQIVLCTKPLNKTNRKNTFDVLYRTHFKNIRTIPIFLFIKLSEDTNSILHLSNIANLNTQKQTFCYFCMKYLTNAMFKTHRCKMYKCKSCYRFKMRDIDINGISQCGSSLIEDLPTDCPKCCIKFDNFICQSMHKLSRKICVKATPLKIQNTNKNYFCKTCLGSHEKGGQCTMFPFNEKKIDTNVNFVFYNYPLNECYVIKMNYKQELSKYSNLTIVNAHNADNFSFSDVEFDIKSLDRVSPYRVQTEITEQKRKHVLDSILKICGSSINTNNVIVCDDSFFQHLFTYFYDETSKAKLKNGQIQHFKIQKISIVHLDIFIDNGGGGLIDVSYLLNPDRNHAILIPPLIPTHNLLASFTFNKQYFDIEKYRYSSAQSFKSVKKSLDNIPSMFWSGQLKAYEILRINGILQCNMMHNYGCILNTLYNKLRIEIGYCRTNVFQHFSKSKIGFDLLLKCLDKQNVPILPSACPKIIQNFSKIEYCMSHLLNQIHKNCKSKYSNFINERVLFKVSKISADFACLTCKEYFFIQGTYKIVCKRHQKHPDIEKMQFNRLTKSENVQLNRSKIKVFKNGISADSTVFEFSNCCLQDMDNYEFFMEYLKSKNVFTPHEAIAMFRQSLKSYKRANISGINYNDCISNPLVLPINYMCISKEALIYRYDITNAFPSALNNVRLPFGKAKIYIDNEARLFYDSYTTQHDEMFVIKVKLECSSNTFIPYYDHRNTKNETIKSIKRSATCVKCCLTSNNLFTNCKHRDRSFVINCTDEDLQYALQTGCKIISIFEIHLFKTKNIPLINSLCTAYKDLQDKAECKLERKMLKELLLISIGRTALDIRKFKDEIFIDSPESLFCKLASLNHFDVLANGMVCTATLLKQPTCKVEQFIRYKTCPIIFALVSSKVKRMVHQHALAIHFSKTLTLIRLDTDCISFVVSGQDSMNLIDTIFYKNNSIFKYKIEHKHIRCILSYSKMSYILMDAEGNLIFKIPGAFMSNSARFSTNISAREQVNTFIDNCLDKLYNPKRILPRIPAQPVHSNNTYTISSYPFGFKI